MKGSSNEEDRVVIGRVVKPHGVRGEVAVEPLTDFPERFVEGLSVEGLIEGEPARPLRVATVRWHAGRVLLTFEGVEGMDAAEALRGLDLTVTRSETAARPAGFVFHYEVQGAVAVDREGRELGRVLDLVETAGRPLLVLETPRGEREVPFTHPLVVSVDVAAKKIVLDPPQGLLD